MPMKVFILLIKLMKTWGIQLKSAYLVQSGQIANIPYISDCGLMLGLQTVANCFAIPIRSGVDL